MKLEDKNRDTYWITTNIPINLINSEDFDEFKNKKTIMSIDEARSMITYKGNKNGKIYHLVAFLNEDKKLLLVPDEKDIAICCYQIAEQNNKDDLFDGIQKIWNICPLQINIKGKINELDKIIQEYDFKPLKLWNVYGYFISAIFWSKDRVYGTHFGRRLELCGIKAMLKYGCLPENSMINVGKPISEICKTLKSYGIPKCPCNISGTELNDECEEIKEDKLQTNLDSFW